MFSGLIVFLFFFSSVHETFNPMNNKALITNQYKHSLLSTNNALNIDLNSSSNQQNVAEQQQTASRIHFLPPLPKTDTNKFTDRQRRTHLLQKQRLRKENINWNLVFFSFLLKTFFFCLDVYHRNFKGSI